MTLTIHPTQLADDPVRREEVLDLLRRASEADGVDPLSEQFVVGLADARLNHHHVLAIEGCGTGEGERIVGVIAVEPGGGDDDSVAPANAELAVDPKGRRQGVGRKLIEAAQSLVDPRSLNLWAHGNLEPAKELAESLGRQETRRLLVMRIAGDALADAARYTLPERMHVLSAAQAEELWGTQAVESAWLEANNEAFDWHPEQGGWTIERLHRAMEAPWFSLDDVLLLFDGAVDGGDLADGGTMPALVGFHWTKWHDEPAEVERAGGREFGEVYVVGLASNYRGQGLGSPLIAIGLDHLSRRGASEIILYVESDNSAAVKAYEKLGFGTSEQHSVYSLTE